MGLLNGNQFRITLGDNILLCETSSGVSFNNSLMEVTKSDSGTYAEYISGQKSATVSFDNLYSFDPIEVGMILEFHIGPRSSGFTGTGIVESLEVSAASDDVVTHSGTMKVIGELEKFIPDIETQFLRARGGEDILTRDGNNIQVRTQVN